MLFLLNLEESKKSTKNNKYEYDSLKDIDCEITNKDKNTYDSLDDKTLSKLNAFLDEEDKKEKENFSRKDNLFNYSIIGKHLEKNNHNALSDISNKNHENEDNLSSNNFNTLLKSMKKTSNKIFNGKNENSFFNIKKPNKFFINRNNKLIESGKYNSAKNQYLNKSLDYSSEDFFNLENNINSISNSVSNSFINKKKNILNKNFDSKQKESKIYYTTTIDQKPKNSIKEINCNFTDDSKASYIDNGNMDIDKEINVVCFKNENNFIDEEKEIISSVKSDEIQISKLDMKLLDDAENTSKALNISNEDAEVIIKMEEKDTIIANEIHNNFDNKGKLVDSEQADIFKKDINQDEIIEDFKKKNKDKILIESGIAIEDPINTINKIQSVKINIIYFRIKKKKKHTCLQR